MDIDNIDDVLLEDMMEDVYDDLMSDDLGMCIDFLIDENESRKEIF
jgi:hypothetical protein